jgi:hypothetical protein
MVVSVKEKARHKTGSGMDHGDECKRTTDEVSKVQGCRQNWDLFLFQDKLGGNLFTARAAAGINMA